jgi:N4-gp56 family major capsid protein
MRGRRKRPAPAKAEVTGKWNVYSDVADQGGTLTETTTMPETQFTITQGTLTCTEFGNSVPYSGKLDNLSEHPVREIIGKVLKNDCKKAFDIASFAEFNICRLRAIPATAGTATSTITLTTDGTATGTNNISLRAGHVRAIVDQMKERNIPPYVGDDYACIAWPSTYRTFKQELESIHQYTESGFSLIHSGEIGRYENVRFVEQTFIAKGYSWQRATNTATAWASGNDWAFFFGEDTVAEGIVIPEEIRGKIPSNYGLSKGIAWYALEGFGIVHNQTVATQARILKWDTSA